MKPIEPSVLGHAINATADTSTDAEYMKAVLDTYLWAYNLDVLGPNDEERLRDLVNRINGFQILRADARFGSVFGATENTFFSSLVEVLATAEYQFDDAGIATFNHDDVIAEFLSRARSGAH